MSNNGFRSRFLTPFMVAFILFSTVMMVIMVVSACEKSDSEKLERLRFSKEIIGDKAEKVFYSTVIPLSYELRPVVSLKLQTLEGFVRIQRPEVAINGGFFDPNNGETISYVSGTEFKALDPKENPRLTENKNLKPYLDKILNRSELRQYRCQDKKIYGIVSHKTLIPKGCELQFSLGGGPELYPEFSAEAEAFIDHDSDGKLTRDPIGIHRPYARSAVGITEGGQIILGMGGKNPVTKSGENALEKRLKPVGFSLLEMKELMRKAGAVKILALDGGGSSGLYYKGQFFYGKYTPTGEAEKRRLKSVLMAFPSRRQP